MKSVRHETLDRCYSQEGYADLPLEEKNRIYDNIRQEVEKEKNKRTTRTVLKISDYDNQYTCIRDTAQENEYALYFHHWDFNSGYPIRRRKLLGRYPSLCQVLTELHERITA